MSSLRLRDIRVTSVLLCLCVLAASPARAADRIELVSRATAEMVSDTDGAGGSLPAGVGQRPLLSTDGRWSVFISSAPNLFQGQVDLNYVNDIFLHDRVDDTVTLVSHAGGALATAANGVSSSPSISADGRWIAFVSEATNLIPGLVDNNTRRDVFLFDRDTGAITLVSRSAASATTTGNDASYDAQVSADGSAVVYLSSSQALMTGQVETGSNDDVFVWTRATGTNTLVTHTPTSVNTAHAGFTTIEPVISGDGNWVAYASGSTNLVAGASDTNSRTDIFLWSRAANASQIVSRSNISPTTTGNGNTSAPRINADGSRVLFISDGTNHVVGQVEWNQNRNDAFLFSRDTAAVALVSHNFVSLVDTANIPVVEAALSADGNWVAMASSATNHVNGSDNNASPDIFLWSRADGSIILVSRREGTTTTTASTPGSGPSGVRVSDDGRFVLYQTRATNLVPGQTDTNTFPDLFVFDRTTGANALVSGAGASAGQTGNGEVKTLAISGDGRWLLFAGSGTTYAPGFQDFNAVDDIYIADRVDRTTALVSRRDPGLPSVSAAGDSAVLDTVPSLVATPSVSDDGRFTVFQSTAGNLVPGQVDANGALDVFVHDRVSGQIYLVSRAQGTAVTAANAASRAPVISGNGRWVAFVSRATNLVAGQSDTAETDDVFLWDILTGSTTLVSRSRLGAAIAVGGSTAPVLSADGAHVVFLSTVSAGTFVSGGSDGAASVDAFSWARETGVMTVVSRTASFGPAAANGGVTRAWISADGRYVGLVCTSSGMLLNQNDTANTPDLYQWDRTNGSVVLVSHAATALNTAVGATSPAMSADGNYMTFSTASTTVVSGVTDTNGALDLFLWTRATNTNRLLSRSGSSPTATANGPAEGAALSADGRYIAYISRAQNAIVGGIDNSTTPDVYLFDRTGVTNRLVSHAPGSVTTASNERSWTVAISADGSRVAFVSGATNLVSGQTDTPGTKDLFIYDVATAQVTLASHLATSATAGLPLGCEGGMLSANGRVAAFQSLDAMVVANDHNTRQDVFLWIEESGTDLAIAKTNGVSSLVPGQTATWLITATNSGPLPVNGAVVTDTVPAAIQGVTWTCAAGGGAVCGGASGSGSLSRVVNLPVNGTVTFTVTGTVSPDATGTVSPDATGTVSPDATGTLANTASIAPPAGVTDSNPANNSATDTDTLTPQADLLIAVSDSPDPVGRGASLTYAITMANAGPSTAASVTVTDTLPAGVTFVSASGTGWSCGHAGGVVTCTRPSQAPSPTVPAITVVVTAPAAAGIPTLTNTVAISAATNDPVANNTASTQTAVTQPSILVGPEQVRTTTEAGGTATFSVVLGSAPLAPVTITFTSSDTAEGTVSPASVTFTPSDWSVVQAVTVTGVDDSYDDGDVAFTIVSAAATSADAGYAGIDPADVPVTNQDDDTAGFGLTAHPLGMITTEAGGTTPFTISLTSKPRADVTVSFTSLDTAEGTVSPASVTFTPDDWNQTRTVTITGVDDFYDDGDVTYTVTLNPAVSTDAGYAGIDPPDASVVNQDDDAAGFSVTPGAGLATTEAGGTDTFTVVLTARPRSAVAVSVESSDTDEGTVDADTLTFTTDDWNTPKTVTVTGVDDAYDDGDAVYEVALGAAASADLTWNGIDPSDVAASNEDDDTAGIAVAPFEGLLTTEGGGTATFTVTLQARPTQDVTIALASDDGTEGRAAPATLTFTTDDWDTPQTVTVTGQDDDYVDGDIAYTVVLEAAESGDAAFDGIDPADVAVTNRDDGYEGVLYTITPCRVLDSRRPGFGPPLKTNEVAVVEVRGTCGIPATARAVALTLTFSGATQPGTILVFPGDLTQPPVDEFLRIRATHPRSMSAIMPLGVDGTLGIMPVLRAPKLNPTVHIILDVSGYFE